MPLYHIQERLLIVSNGILGKLTVTKEGNMLSTFLFEVFPYLFWGFFIVFEIVSLVKNRLRNIDN